MNVQNLYSIWASIHLSLLTINVALRARGHRFGRAAPMGLVRACKLPKPAGASAEPPGTLQDSVTKNQTAPDKLDCKFG